MFKRTVDHQLALELALPYRAPEIFKLIDTNRAHLDPWFPWVAKSLSVSDTQTFLASRIRSLAETGELECVMLFNGTPVGLIGICPLSGNPHQAEIGYWIAKEYTGKGLVTKSCRVVIEYCFNILNVNSILIRAVEQNVRSWAVAERLGFHHDGTDRMGICVNGVFSDCRRYSLLRTEWQADIKQNE